MRRTLHRAFSDRLGVGPIEYMKRKRLSVIHSILARSDPATTNVSDTAMEIGFFELGRFAKYYRKLFGENPSETLRKWRAAARIANRWRHVSVRSL